jgi:hypothetical protein
MSPHSRMTAAIAGAALLAAIVPAAARAGQRADDPPQHPVPAGQLQHTVIETTFPPATNTSAHHSRREERWIGADAGRVIETDTTTGKTIHECEFTRSDASCWFAPEFRSDPPGGTILTGPTRSVLRSWVDESEGVRSLLAQGYYHIAGNTTFLGRPALLVADKGPSPSPDGGTGSASVIVDAATYFTLWREDRLIDSPATKGKQSLDQITETKVMEVLSPDSVKLTIDSHPGAVVRDERAAAAKAAARRRAAARRAAARRKKHHKPRHRKGY